VNITHLHLDGVFIMNTHPNATYCCSLTLLRKVVSNLSAQHHTQDFPLSVSLLVYCFSYITLPVLQTEITVNTYWNSPVKFQVQYKWTKTFWLLTLPNEEETCKCMAYCNSVKVKVKQYHYKPGHAMRVPGVWGSQIWRQLAHEGGKVISPTHRPPLPPRKYSWYSFLLKAESTPGPYCEQKEYVNEKF